MNEQIALRLDDTDAYNRRITHLLQSLKIIEIATRDHKPDTWEGYVHRVASEAISEDYRDNKASYHIHGVVNE